MDRWMEIHFGVLMDGFSWMALQFMYVWMDSMDGWMDSWPYLDEWIGD